MKLDFMKSVLILLFVPVLAYSQTGSKARRFALEFNALFGWGNSQTATDAKVPSIGSFDLGVGLGINIKKITLGMSYDYRTLTQYSDVDSTVGNRRGTFITPASLFVRLNFEKVKFSLMLINSGTYQLTNIAATGQKVAYTEPSGFRFDVIFKKMKKLTPLIFYESASFSGMTLDGAKAALASNLNYSSFGAGIKYEF